MRIRSLWEPIKIFLVLYVAWLMFMGFWFYRTLSHMDLVIARYKEPITYLNNPLFQSFRKIYVYNKGPDFPDGSVPEGVIVRRLPNVGCEVHTYLSHMRDNTDRDCEKTLFLPGSWFDIWYKRINGFRLMYMAMFEDFIASGKNLNSTVYETCSNFQVESYEYSHISNKSTPVTVELSEDRPFGTWYKKRFGDRDSNQVTLCGLLMVSQSRIDAQRSLGLYDPLLQDVEGSAHPEALHYMERSWATLFAFD